MSEHIYESPNFDRKLNNSGNPDNVTRAPNPDNQSQKMCHPTVNAAIQHQHTQPKLFCEIPLNPRHNNNTHLARNEMGSSGHTV